MDRRRRVHVRSQLIVHVCRQNLHVLARSRRACLPAPQLPMLRGAARASFVECILCCAGVLFSRQHNRPSHLRPHPLRPRVRACVEDYRDGRGLLPNVFHTCKIRTAIDPSACVTTRNFFEKRANKRANAEADSTQLS